MGLFIYYIPSFQPPFPHVSTFSKKARSFGKIPHLFWHLLSNIKTRGYFLQIFKECLNFTLIRHNFFHFWPLPPWKMRTSYMDSPCSRTYCSYSQIDVQMSPFIDSTTSLVTIVICNVKTILHFLFFWSLDLFATYVLQNVPLSLRVNKNTYYVQPLDTKL